MNQAGKNQSTLHTRVKGTAFLPSSLIHLPLQTEQKELILSQQTGKKSTKSMTGILSSAAIQSNSSHNDFEHLPTNFALQNLKSKKISYLIS